MVTSGKPVDETTPAPFVSDHRGLRALRAAWISVAAMPVAFVLAMVLGESLLSLQGFDSGSGQDAPLRAVLLAGIPALLLLLAPTVSAIWFGFRARRLGRGGGTVPAVIGIVVAAWTILTNLPVLLLRFL
ncbi:hypothetical protein QMG61_07240 [Cryobacterium sp. PH31-AA6]|uniref:hypothetical protein n=1 Tax=Cryobacterium sp. PH31-AA6 TaxID=3046205 RepID=UPI0024BB9187|nr:hypothetical protein [Cryobacterium sp. PH31-AA6]MDJ0323555.1 hypothetical protein [Cryobacterium sp. PH31-AA6]